MSKPSYEPQVLGCTFCWKNYGRFVKAIIVAPQYTGGDDDEPATWVPTCDVHFEDWYTEFEGDDMPFEDKLPFFRLTEGRLF